MGDGDYLVAKKTIHQEQGGGYNGDVLQRELQTEAAPGVVVV